MKWMKGTRRVGVASMMALTLAIGAAACDESGGDEREPTGNPSSQRADEPRDDRAVESGDDTSGDVMESGDDASQSDPPVEAPGNSPSSQPSDDADEASLPPLERAELETWLDEGQYMAWSGESAPHNSTGPHFGQVQTFINPALEAALLRGDATFPEGAATVKELYGGDGSPAPLGFAVMVKLADDSAGGDNWYWFESYEGRVFADGQGAGLCTGCHSGGRDFFLTPFPLR